MDYYNKTVNDRSKTCLKLHNRDTGLYLYSDLYIVEDYLIEIGFLSK